MVWCFTPLVEESSERFLSTQWAASFLFMAFLSISKLIIPKFLPAVLTWLLCIIIVLEIAALLTYTFPCCLSNKVHFKQTSFVLWKTPVFFFFFLIPLFHKGNISPGQYYLTVWCHLPNISQPSCHCVFYKELDISSFSFPLPLPMAESTFILSPTFVMS